VIIGQTVQNRSRKTRGPSHQEILCHGHGGKGQARFPSKVPELRTPREWPKGLEEPGISGVADLLYTDRPYNFSLVPPCIEDGRLYTIGMLTGYERVVQHTRPNGCDRIYF